MSVVVQEVEGVKENETFPMPQYCQDKDGKPPSEDY